MPSLLYNTDCMSYMASLPMGHFDLTIADPPYGIGRDWEKRDRDTRRKFANLHYNNDRISESCIREIIRVSKHWIIWGWNYFTDFLPPTNNLIVWDKMSNCNQAFRYSKAEIAGTDIKIPCNLVANPMGRLSHGRGDRAEENTSAPEAGRALSLASRNLRTQGKADFRSIRRFWKSRRSVQAAWQGIHWL